MLWVRIPLGARHTTLCDTFCQLLTAGRWFSPGTPVSPNNKTDHHDITEILLKVALNTIDQTKQSIYALDIWYLLEDLYDFVVWFIIIVKYFNSIFHIVLSRICIFRTQCIPLGRNCQASQYLIWISKTTISQTHNKSNK